VAEHFSARLLTQVPDRPPYGCPLTGCHFSGGAPQETAHHLGTSHSSVLLQLVRETVPRYSFQPEFDESNTVLLTDTSDEETGIEIL
jgi:hypothetical protein